MPKNPTFPTLYNEASQINISKLKKWGYLNSNQISSGVLTWSIRGNQTGSISICVNMTKDQPYIELDYTSRKRPRKYKIKLVSKPSNLGKGKMWFFQCPQTNKLCRKLYSISGYFLHREAFKGCMYESQTQSHQARELDRVLSKVFSVDKLDQELYSKHFTKYYNGKPTKRYVKIMKRQYEASQLSSSEVLKMIRNSFS